MELAATLVLEYVTPEDKVRNARTEHTIFNDSQVYLYQGECPLREQIESWRIRLRECVWIQPRYSYTDYTYATRYRIQTVKIDQHHDVAMLHD